MNREQTILRFKNRIKELKDFRNFNIIITLGIAGAAVLGGIGLGYLFNSIPKTLVITLALAGILETYPIQGINKANQEIERLENDIEGVKNDKSFDKGPAKEQTKTLKKEQKYQYTYDEDKAYPSDYYDDFENKHTNSRR